MILALALSLAPCSVVQPQQGQLPVQVARLTVPGGAAGVGFGDSLAVSGDWIAVGAPQGDFGGASYGAVHLYHRNGGGIDAWGLVQTLVPSALGGLGRMLNMEDGTLAAFGNLNVSVYVEQGNTWVLEAMIPVPPTPNSLRSMALAEDTIALTDGYFWCYPGEGTSEVVNVYERDAGGPSNWGLATVLYGSYLGSKFGTAVRADGNRIVVSEYPSYYQCGFGALPLHVYRKDVDTQDWVFEQLAVPPPNGGLLGYHMAMDGDLVLAVDSNGTNVFDRNAGGSNAWNPNGLASDASALDLSGDRMFLARQPVAAGPFEVEVRERHLGGENAWGLVGVLTPPDSSPGDGFGLTLAADGDVLAAATGGPTTATVEEAVCVYALPAPPGPSGPFRKRAPVLLPR